MNFLGIAFVGSNDVGSNGVGLRILHFEANAGARVGHESVKVTSWATFWRWNRILTEVKYESLLRLDLLRIGLVIGASDNASEVVNCILGGVFASSKILDVNGDHGLVELISGSFMKWMRSII